MIEEARYDMVVIGASAGGLRALKAVLCGLPSDFSLAVAIAQHIAATSNGDWIQLLNAGCNFPVKEAEEKERISSGTAYVAPANYHLLVERDHSFSLTVDAPVNYARPSIDVLFETAADAYRERLVGIVLTGANADGAAGLRQIRDNGGLVVAQHPDTAEATAMPAAAILAVEPELILSPPVIGDLLYSLHRDKQKGLLP